MARLLPTPPRPVAVPPDCPDAGDLRRLRVLVADDDVDAATALCELLRVLGCATRAAHDGAQCLSASAGFAPHLSFIDLQMPDMTGIEVVRELRKGRSEGHGRLICLTGHDRAGDRPRCLAAGFEELVVKPLTLDALASAVADLRDD